MHTIVIIRPDQEPMFKTIPVGKGQTQRLIQILLQIVMIIMSNHKYLSDLDTIWAYWLDTSPPSLL